MNRPSRLLRESATTILKKGRFFAPPRASRMTTISFPAVLPADKKKDVDYTAKRGRVARRPLAQPRQCPAHSPQHLLHPALGHHLHHLLRLLELIEQSIDFLHRDAGTGGDPSLARGLEQLRSRPLRGGHRADDRLQAPDGAFIHLARLRRPG